MDKNISEFLEKNKPKIVEGGVIGLGVGMVTGLMGTPMILGSVAVGAGISILYDHMSKYELVKKEEKESSPMEEDTDEVVGNT